MGHANAENNGTPSERTPNFAPINDAAEVAQRPGRPITNDTPEAAKRRERDRAYRERKKAEQGAGQVTPRASAQPSQPSPGTPPASPGAPGAAQSGPSPLGKTVDDLKSRFAADDGTGAPGQQQVPSPAAFTATGAVLLGMCNAVLPNLFATFTNRGRVEPVSADTFRLTDKETELLKPSAAPAEAYLLMNLHPVAIFAIALAGTMYAKTPPKTKADLAAEAEEAKAKKAARVRAKGNA